MKKTNAPREHATINIQLCDRNNCVTPRAGQRFVAQETMWTNSRKIKIKSDET